MSVNPTPTVELVSRLRTVRAEVGHQRAFSVFGEGASYEAITRCLDAIDEAADRLAVLEAENQQLRSLIGDFVDPDPCHFDHHGYCQAHNWFETDPACPHARAKALPGRYACVHCGGPVDAPESVHIDCVDAWMARRAAAEQDPQ